MEVHSIQIQLSNSSSLEEYLSALEEGIDWDREIGLECPICKRRGCWRRITPYWRTVIELFPYRVERIPIQRFLCRKTLQTFSLLPVWLAPYHQYTLGSMLMALLLAATAEPGGIWSLFAVAEKKLDPDCKANGFLLDRWLTVCVSGLRRAHAELARWAALGDLVPCKRNTRPIPELLAYCHALGIRGPPLVGLDEVLQRHARTTKLFLFGTPSQER